MAPEGAYARAWRMGTDPLYMKGVVASRREARGILVEVNPEMSPTRRESPAMLMNSRGDTERAGEVVQVVPG